MTASNPRKTEADALYRKKKYGEAATAYSAALKLEPTNEKIYSTARAASNCARSSGAPRSRAG